MLFNVNNFILQRNTRGTDNPADCFKFNIEDRVECLQSKKVKYTNRDDFMLSLPIPMEAATNKGKHLCTCVHTFFSFPTGCQWF